jgi:hypothetical protein
VELKRFLPCAGASPARERKERESAGEMASASASGAAPRDYDDQDEDEPSSSPADASELTPAINCEVAGENGMYGQFTWTVALPAYRF